MYVLVAIAIVLGVLRIGGMANESYQAVAHLFVGGLFASGWTLHRHALDLGDAMRGWHYIGLGVALSVLELGCFLWFKFAGVH